MKKLYVFFLCTAIILGLSSCSKEKSASPKEVTTAFLNAYIKKDSEQIIAHSEWEHFDVKTLEMQDKDLIDGIDKQLQKDIYNMIQTFEHTEGKETIKDATATVEVTLKVYNFTPAVEIGMEEATKKAAELAKDSNISDEKAQQTIIDTIYSNVKKAKKDKTLQVNIHLKLINGKWLVANENADLENALITNAESLQSIGK